MRAQGDSARNPLSAEPVQVQPVEGRRADRDSAGDALRDRTGAGKNRTDEGFLQQFLPVLLRALSAWPT
jgi:hypothetical protein